MSPAPGGSRAFSMPHSRCLVSNYPIAEYLRLHYTSVSKIIKHQSHEK